MLIGLSSPNHPTNLYPQGGAFNFGGGAAAGGKPLFAFGGAAAGANAGAGEGGSDDGGDDGGGGDNEVFGGPEVAPVVTLEEVPKVTGEERETTLFTGERRMFGCVRWGACTSLAQ